MSIYLKKAEGHIGWKGDKYNKNEDIGLNNPQSEI